MLAAVPKAASTLNVARMMVDVLTDLLCAKMRSVMSMSLAVSLSLFWAFEYKAIVALVMLFLSANKNALTADAILNYRGQRTVALPC